MAGLTVLALAAAVMSATALMPYSSAIPTVNSATTVRATPTEFLTSTASAPTRSPHKESSSSTSGDSNGTPGDTVTIVGDQYSVSSTPDNWVNSAAAELGWGTFTNQSISGRRYLAQPTVCTGDECSTFQGLIEKVAGMDPDVVITVGGTADGDRRQDRREIVTEVLS